MKKLEGKVVAITGGNSGIGLGVAKLFKTEGAKIAMIGRDQKTLDQTITELGDGHLGFRGDVTSNSDLDKFFELIKNRYGRIDVLFVNAGISKIAKIGDVTEESYDEIFNINTRGAFFTVQKALPLMGRGTSIVMTASTVAQTGSPMTSLYSASKSAIRSFVRNFAAELVDQGIRVNAVSPGPIDTPIMPRSSEDPEGMKNMLKHVVDTMIPMKRIGTPEEVAKAALFLASDDSSFTTGAEIMVDGGMTQF